MELGVQSMIRCTDLTKRFGRHTAVNAVEFEIQAGEICALMGHNGAGKSTLLRLLAGLLHADSGTASVAGHDPHASSSAFRHSIGVVPDNLALLPELTIQEQLAASGPVYGLDKRTTRERSQELLELLELYEVRKTYVREGSHGMRKKTAIALALLHNPAVLLLDEPFEGVDPASAETLATLFAAMARRGTTVLFSSHLLPHVDRIAQRIIVMRDGAVECNEVVSDSPRGAEALYFDSLGARPGRDIAWLGSRQS
jgi:ABC-2 type transport system ATP-binding protein